MPIKGEVIEIYTTLKDNARLVNTESYTGGWLIKIKSLDNLKPQKLMNAQAYESLIS